MPDRPQPLDALAHVQQARDSYLDEIARLRAELEESGRMRDSLRLERDGIEHVRQRDNGYLLGEIASLREQAYLDLVRYGRHEDGCAVLTLFPPGGPLSMPCSCGFAQARERCYLEESTP